MNRRPLRSLLAVLVLGLGAVTARGQGETAPTIAELEAAVHELELEVAALRAAGRRDPQRAEELEALLTAEGRALLEIEGEAAALRSELAFLDAEAASPEVAGRGADLELAVEQARAVIERHDILLSEVPAESRRREELADLAAALDTDPDAALAKTLALLVDLRLDAGCVRLDRVRLHTAGGREETVDLLRGGFVAHAYRVVEDGRIGVAVASPADASGHRWTEELDAGLVAEIAASFAALEDGEAAMISVPLDPTGRARPEHDAAGSGLLGRFRAGGPVMWPLLAVALAALVIVVERTVVLARAGRGRTRAARAVEAYARGDLEGARALCRDGGVVGRALDAGLAREAAGPEAMEAAIEAQLLHELPRLQRLLPALAVLAAAAPLLGLLGTVTGIIETFSVLESFGAARPGMLAGGISEALVTTAAGLVIAIPILIATAALEGRVDLVLGESERRSADLIDLAARGRAR